MDFFLKPMNLALTVTAVISGSALIWSTIFGSKTSRLTVTEATMLINKRAQVIDVRPVEAYAVGHIQNARSLPLDHLTEQLPLLKLKKDKPVLIVCERGITAVKAAILLTKAEYTDVHVIEGGLKAWKEAQLPIIKS